MTRDEVKALIEFKIMEKGRAPDPVRDSTIEIILDVLFALKLIKTGPPPSEGALRVNAAEYAHEEAKGSGAVKFAFLPPEEKTDYVAEVADAVETNRRPRETP